MSNYSVKLTKCGKCQFSSAHLPRGCGGRRPCGDLRGPARGGGLDRAVSTAGGGRQGAARAPGTPAAAGTPWLGPREGAAAPDQMARVLNY